MSGVMDSLRPAAYLDPTTGSVYPAHQAALVDASRPGEGWSSMLTRLYDRDALCDYLESEEVKNAVEEAVEPYIDGFGEWDEAAEAAIKTIVQKIKGG